MPIDVLENPTDMFVPVHEAYIDTLTERPHLETMAPELATPQESLLKHRPERVYVSGKHQPKRLDITPEAPLFSTSPGSEVAKTARFVARHIVPARNREIALDLSQARQANPSAPSSREKAARLIAGNYAYDVLSSIFRSSTNAQVYERQKHYLEAEAKIGGEILGDIHSAFYCFDEHTFIWHPAGAEDNVRYVIRENDILKQYADHQFSRLAGEELENFNLAVREYYQQVAKLLYTETNGQFALAA